MAIVEFINKLTTLIIALGTILSITSLRIDRSPVEETFINGKSHSSALIGIMYPRLLKIGYYLLVIGCAVQVIIYFI